MDIENNTEKKKKYNSWMFSESDVKSVKYGAFVTGVLGDKSYQQLYNKYRQLLRTLENDRLNADLKILEKADIVGMTVNGCSKYSERLSNLDCKITVIEEAAEIMEAQTLSILTRKTEHLILIGDHKQLRPNLNNHNLVENFQFDVSLFERLINNNIEFVMLQHQRRMRPEIADFIRHSIYGKNYKDHSDVKEMEPIKGMAHNVFLYHHKEFEASLNGITLSKKNIHEAQMVTKLTNYLIQQDYDQSQITILSMYLGQVGEIKHCLKICNLDNVKVTTVDNYQGEENDIVIVSIVRSNRNQKLGFTGIENRVNVALSRARKGLYVLGNFDMLMGVSKLWKQIGLFASKEKLFGDSFVLMCKNHKIVTKARFPRDFDTIKEGGCENPCNFVYECGHKW
jgi:superfamily I DNA and/or RNA helicase